MASQSWVRYSMERDGILSLEPAYFHLGPFTILIKITGMRKKLCSVYNVSCQPVPRSLLKSKQQSTLFASVSTVARLLKGRWEEQ